MTHVFVYGTLKRGGRNHRFIAAQQFLGEARTPAGFTLYSLGRYPGMVRAPNDVAGVVGEIWAVDDACVTELDRLEGLAEGLYERVTIILLPPFAETPAQTYLYLRDLSGRPAIGSVWRE